MNLHDFLAEVRRTWGVGSDAGQLPAQVLAYLGDAVYELLVRTRLVALGPAPADSIHKTAVSLVRAESQALVLKRIAAQLTDDEKLIVRRGRNVQIHRVRKGVGAEFQASTGFEALLGYLFVTENFDRIMQLLDIAPSEQAQDEPEEDKQGSLLKT